jgi:hypothetical protein
MFYHFKTYFAAEVNLYLIYFSYLSSSLFFLYCLVRSTSVLVYIFASSYLQSLINMYECYVFCLVLVVKSADNLTRLLIYSCRCFFMPDIWACPLSMFFDWF